MYKLKYRKFERKYKKEFKKIIKKDKAWDYDYLIKILCAKIRQMYEYFESISNIAGFSLDFDDNDKKIFHNSILRSSIEEAKSLVDKIELKEIYDIEIELLLKKRLLQLVQQYFDLWWD